MHMSLRPRIVHLTLLRFCHSAVSMGLMPVSRSPLPALAESRRTDGFYSLLSNDYSNGSLVLDMELGLLVDEVRHDNRLKGLLTARVSAARGLRWD